MYYKYCVRRISYSVLVVFGAVTIVFLMMNLIPGDVAMFIAGPDATEEVIENIRGELGLDRPLYQQYWEYLNRLIRGDMGRSLLTKQPVAPEIWKSLTRTLELVVTASAIAITLGLFLGAMAAFFRGSFFDRICTTLAVLGSALPTFWTGLILMYFFSYKFLVLPASGRGGFPLSSDGFIYILLPAVTLAFLQLPTITRMTRSYLLDILNQDYIRTARAKGLHEIVVVSKHAMKNVAIHVLTVLGLQMGLLLGGAVVVETIFSWPGLGRLIVRSILARDILMVQGGVAAIAISFCVINLMVDLLSATIDPRLQKM